MICCRRRAARLGPAALAAALLASGCRDREPAGPPAAEQPAPAAEYGVFADAPREVTLLARGAEPRRALAYRMHRARREARVGFTVGAPGTGRGAAPPAIALLSTLVWTRSGPPGAGATYDFALRDLEPALPADMSDEERAIVGSIHAMFGKVTGRVHAGAAGPTRLAQTGGLPTQPSWMWLLHAAMVPLPAEPVGPGARWRSRQTLTTPEGLTGVEEREGELVSFDGERARVKVTGTVSFVPPAATAGEMAVVGARLETSGSALVDPADPLPASASLQIRQSTRFQLPGLAAPDQDGGPPAAAEEQTATATTRFEIDPLSGSAAP